MTNLLEQLLVEERRRLKIIPNRFGEKPALKLMFAAPRSRALACLRFTEFELRQIAAVLPESRNAHSRRRARILLRSTSPMSSSWLR
jgi:hypothetical protein